MTILGSLKVLGLWDGRDLDRGMKKSLKGVKTLGQSLKELGQRAKKAAVFMRNIAGGVGAGLGGLAAIAERTAQATLQQNRFADALGISTAHLIGYQRAAARLNVTQDVMNDALLELSRRSSEATEGTGSMFDALNILGIEVEAFSKLSLDKQFTKITQSISGLKSAAQRNFLTDEIFGGASDTISGLLPQLDELARGIDMVGVASQNEKALEFAKRWDSISKNLATIGREFTIGISGPALEAVQGLSVILEGLGIIRDPGKKGSEARADPDTALGSIGIARRNAINFLAEVFAGMDLEFRRGAVANQQRAAAITPRQRSFEQPQRELRGDLGYIQEQQSRAVLEGAALN